MPIQFFSSKENNCDKNIVLEGISLETTPILAKSNILILKGMDLKSLKLFIGFGCLKK